MVVFWPPFSAISSNYHPSNLCSYKPHQNFKGNSAHFKKLNLERPTRAMQQLSIRARKQNTCTEKNSECKLLQIERGMTRCFSHSIKYCTSRWEAIKKPLQVHATANNWDGNANTQNYKLTYCTHQTCRAWYNCRPCPVTYTSTYRVTCGHWSAQSAQHSPLSCDKWSA